jgi:hypothetical protein
MILFIKFFGGLKSLVPGATVFRKFLSHHLFPKELLVMCKKFFRTGVVAVILASLFSTFVVSPAVADGITWRSQTTPVDGANENAYQSVAYGNGWFVAVGDGPVTGRRVLTSSDGINWTMRNAATIDNWQSVTYGTINTTGYFVGVGRSGTNRIMASTNSGVSWGRREAPEGNRDNNWKSVTYGNGVFVAVSSDGTNRVMTTNKNPIGITDEWTSHAVATNAWQSVTYGNGVFVAVSDNTSGDINNRVMTSTNGTTWVARAASANNAWQSVTYGNGVFVAVSSDGNLNRVMTSPAPPAFTLTSASESRTVNTAATGFTTNSTGGAIASFTINATPPGMSFNTTNGALSGTPNTVAAATTYTVTATNASGSTTQTFTLTVTAVLAPAFTLSASSESRTVNTAATGFTANSTGGAIASFAISATPPGMSFNTTTGALTGTPNTVAAATTYTVTATNASGSTTQTFTLTVTAVLAAPAFTLSASSESRTVNTLATGFSANSTGGAIASFAISATPAGMSFNTTNGALSGTPNTVAAATTYTVTATNASGNATQTFTLTVTAAPVVADNSVANAEAAQKAKEQRELTEILSIIPELGRLSLNLGKTSQALVGQRCVKKKEVRFVKKGAKCPKGFRRA